MADFATELKKWAENVGRDIASLNTRVANIPTTGNSTNPSIKDTGWRKITSPNMTAGYLLMRRIDNMVYVTATGGNWGTVSLKKQGQSLQWSSSNDKILLVAPNGVPQGFRAQRGIYTSIYRDNGDYFGMLYIHGADDQFAISVRGRNQFASSADTAFLRVSTASYVTDEAWPSALPGTAADGAVTPPQPTTPTPPSRPAEPQPPAGIKPLSIAAKNASVPMDVRTNKFVNTIIVRGENYENVTIYMRVKNSPDKEYHATILNGIAEVNIEGKGVYGSNFKVTVQARYSDVANSATLNAEFMVTM